MKTADLDFPFPDELIATEPVRPSRVLWHDGRPAELSFDQFLEQIHPGDLVVLNDTKVLRRRVFAGELEILFLASDDERRRWTVLFPSRAFELGARIDLPEGRAMTLTKKGRPQEVETDQPLDEAYFERIAELPLPPYIQKARAERRARPGDQAWYQTAWAEKPGSFAAPTASLHLKDEHLNQWRAKGVRFARVTLHVGLGTFLPVVADDLDQHQMHSEWAEVPAETVGLLRDTRASGRRVWAVGTTVARALESAAAGRLQPDGHGGLRGLTDLMIQPGFEWKSVDVLVTNFHQPRSTLLALVASFAGLENVRRAYGWAIDRKFRLFSYGDMTVWTR